MSGLDSASRRIEFFMTHIPKSHPRAISLYTRESLVAGHKRGLVAPEGLIAQGRGEAFDYIMGEKTTRPARRAARAAAAALLLAKRPVISVNGNLAALCPRQTIRLARRTRAVLEINLFYDSPERRRKIARHLTSLGAKGVLGAKKSSQITLGGLDSARRIIDKDGIAEADTVMVSMEDGDRTEALVKSGKLVIAIDLNPLSRTARKADITIVDNVTRALDVIAEQCTELKDSTKPKLHRILDKYDNDAILGEHVSQIAAHLGRAAHNV